MGIKTITVLGTRPELIQLSCIIPKLDKFCDHILVHTGQNFDHNLKDVFFEELGIRQPNHYLGVGGANFAAQTAEILVRCHDMFEKEKPDKVLILGDTNSGLSAFIAARMHIPVYHMEAGNRSHLQESPEEVNRKIIDHISDVNMPYTEGSRQNLIREGIPAHTIMMTGNPIYEVMRSYQSRILRCRDETLARFQVKSKKYFLVTLHREENVDIQERLFTYFKAFEQIAYTFGFPVIVSVYPRTQKRLKEWGYEAGKGVKLCESLPFFSFQVLQQFALCNLSDSGKGAEEPMLLGVPHVILRDSTERPEVIECGSNIMSDCNIESILRCVKVSLETKPLWVAPKEYLVENVSDIVCKIVLGYNHFERRLR